MEQRTTELEAANRQLERAATHDSLTGLLNRRGLFQRLQSEWKRAQRDQKSIAALMIDIDGFKAFNDAHGHQEGDEALRRVGIALQAGCRRGADAVGRYGGEEFLALLPEATLESALERAHALLETVSATGLPGRGVTVSIGVAEARPGQLTPEAEARSDSGGSDLPDRAVNSASGDEDTVETLIRDADRALYLAKGRGGHAVAGTENEFQTPT